MPKETITIQQKVIIKYNTPKDRKELIKALKKNPNVSASYAGYYSIQKAKARIKIL